MKIIDINWLSEVAKEAELVVSDGHNSCVVFSQPCDLHINDVISKPLEAIFTENIMLTDKFEPSINVIREGEFPQIFAAQIVDKDNCLVRVGDIFMILDEKLPIGCENGTFIEFSCERLDLI